MKRIVVGISGASGVELGLKFLHFLPQEIEKYCVITQGAKDTILAENHKGRSDSVSKEEQISCVLTKALQGIPNLTLFEDKDLSASIASGSCICEAMAVIPCSQNTLAKISYGICDTLLTRTASVMIKENRKLLLAPREMPLSPIVLENMLKLSRLGVQIAPPIFGYYAGKSLEEIERFLIGKWCDNLGIPYNYKRWGY
ncbi:UbiX family flavin prenyltransferase [Helicobacter sp.]|uniref:UbiX family flavin prenyltransferase n=1 Tax=Helicobacter sp. TaxID=218 RepID=UPI0025C42881|nr:UbiX family flavin prenyltransferase [Helicobacter sp.]MCI5633646.1 UbiX family flavin prenyltransferase [Helicobacter sp.]MDY5557641.1 UbiX family flavin prenyltransferase [Helicobacter sp.]